MIAKIFELWDGDNNMGYRWMVKLAGATVIGNYTYSTRRSCVMAVTNFIRRHFQCGVEIRAGVTEYHNADFLV